MKASLIVLTTMTVVVAILAAYRWFVAQHEDDFLHLSDPSGQLSTNQRNTAQTLSKVDHVGIGLTIVTAVFGVAILFTYLYAGLK
jgi:hypothetical protein